MASPLGFRTVRCRPWSLSPSICPRQPSPWCRALSVAAETVAAPTNTRYSSFFRRSIRFTGRSLLWTSVGLIMAVAPALEPAAAILSPPSDTETLTMYTPSDEESQTKEDYINSHPLVSALRSDPQLIESRPHMKIPLAWRKQSLTGGTLIGHGKVTVPPFSWCENNGKTYIQISHVGTNLCGHMGIVHGGFLATMLDEGLARCCFPVLPFNIGMTAKLEINYKAPAMANQYLVLRATTTKVEGRKAWVEGQIETLPSREGEEPVVLATASALYVSPKQASVMANVMPVT